MLDEQKPIKKKFSPNEAFLKARRWCAYQERCQQEMRDKLYEWGLYTDAVENIIADLISDNFLNEERFAKAYAGGKFRIKKWGKTKIKLELKKRKISDYCIKKGMQEIIEEEYIRTLKQIIAKKLKEIKGEKIQVRNYKAAQYALSRGYESELIWDIIKMDED
jgi:regulatory protein